MDLDQLDQTQNSTPDTHIPIGSQATPVVENPSQNTESQSIPVENPPTTPTFPNSPNLPDQPESSQPVSSEQPTPIPETTPPQPEPESKPQPQTNIPDLPFPFYGSVSPSLLFNQVPDDERIKQKFQEWGIIGHNGLDFPLSEGTEVLACDRGKVVQVGDNGDYGICVTIQHSWGQSVYAHLKETKVATDREVKVSELIGLSGQTGSAFGAHLHFAIKPNGADDKNGYLGFIDPSPYLKNSISFPASSSPSGPSIPFVPTEPEIKIEPAPEIPKPPETPEVPESSQTPQTPQNPQIPQVPQFSEEEVKKQVNEKLASELEARRLKANEVRKENRQEHLVAIEKFLGQKPEITNQDVRDLVHVSQTTATEYLSTLVKSGRIKTEGKGKATVYKNIFS
jgi:murein DD-endopeptidase MepM/ murein hydrolase activator NlpD